MILWFRIGQKGRRMNDHKLLTGFVSAFMLTLLLAMVVLTALGVAGLVTWCVWIAGTTIHALDTWANTLREQRDKKEINRLNQIINNGTYKRKSIESRKE